MRMPGWPAPPKYRAYADQANEANTPREINVSMVAVACRSPFMARSWNGLALQHTTGTARLKHSHCQ